MLIRELGLDECRKALDRGFGRLGCSFENQPYVVPIQFCMDGDYAYSFSMPGQKLEWMRKNPRVCLEVDDVTNREEWTSVVALGRYEELPDTPDCRADRLRALELLQRSDMWWQPGSVPLTNDADGRSVSPIIYRIALEQLSGRRGLPAERVTTSAAEGNWLGRLFRNVVLSVG